MTRCENCEQKYDEVRCHWRCPHCGWKESCCEGAPANAVSSDAAPGTYLSQSVLDPTPATGGN